MADENIPVLHPVERQAFVENLAKALVDYSLGQPPQPKPDANSGREAFITGFLVAMELAAQIARGQFDQGHATEDIGGVLIQFATREEAARAFHAVQPEPRPHAVEPRESAGMKLGGGFCGCGVFVSPGDEHWCGLTQAAEQREKCQSGEHELGYRKCPMCSEDLHPQVNGIQPSVVVSVHCDKGHVFTDGPEMWGGRVCKHCRCLFVPRES